MYLKVEWLKLLYSLTPCNENVFICFQKKMKLLVFNDHQARVSHSDDRWVSEMFEISLMRNTLLLLYSFLSGLIEMQ